MEQVQNEYEAQAKALEALAAKFAPQGSVIAARFELQRREIAEQVQQAMKEGN